jgi:hypothetical protein
VPLAAALVALWFVVHLVSAGEEASPQHDVASSANQAAPSASESGPPSAAEVASLMAGEPEVTLHSIAGLLPHDERQAQRLKTLEIRALVQQGRLPLARERAREYFERWPGGPETAALEALTDVHPGPVTP